MNSSLPRRVARYVVIDHIGQGGMGVVYRAWDPELRRILALKMLAPQAGLRHSAKALERFAREARAAASLTHRNIVTIHDVGEHRGAPYIAMEFVEGESMAKLIARRAPLSVADKMRLALDLCGGLAFAHDHGIVHRDIKPGNLMIRSDGVLTILDFGLARASDELASEGLTDTGALMGTLNYMSPEQGLGQVADHRSDIFSVGAVLYELFTGQRAFPDDVPARVLLQLLHDDPPRVRHWAPELPERLEAAIATALAKEVSCRYQHLPALSTDLRASLSSSDADLDSLGTLTPPRLMRDPLPPSVEPPSSEFDAVLKDWGAMVGRALDERAPESAAAAPSAPAVAMQPARDDEARGGVAVEPTLRGARGTPPRWLEATAVIAALAAVVLYFFFVLKGGDAAPERADSASPSGPPSSTVPATGQPTSALPAGPSPREPVSTAPATTASPRPAAARPQGGQRAAPASGLPARCTDLLERVGLGEELRADDRTFLSQQCRSGG